MTETSPRILIVAGGMSRRMGRDKSQIECRPGIKQIDYLLALARQFDSEPLMSSNDAAIAPDGVEVLADLHPGAGPLAALEAFHQKWPGEPVLLLGCDQFLLDADTIRQLIANRNPERPATAFANRIDGRVEPLCAIYEPAAVAAARQAVAKEEYCARHFLEGQQPELLKLADPVALDGANTPEELDEVMAKLTDGAAEKSVRVLYFAKLREDRGLSEEVYSTWACTVGGLFEELRFRHRLSLRINALRVACNGEFCDWQTRLKPDDEVVFIPPVAGG